MSASDQEHKGGGYPPLTGVTLVLAAAALSFANFIVVLDTTIANVAMPTISGDLGVSTTEGTWIITAYAAAEAITVPLTGWLARRFGEVRLFVMCVIGFVACSVLCGLSHSLGLLVAFRILQGFAGGPLIPLSATLLISVFPKERANVGLAIWGMTTVVAPIFGPILGGYISDNYHWGWIFHINVLFGAAVASVVWWQLRNRETPIERKRIDVVGLLLLTVFVCAFQVMVDKGRELDWFSSSFIVWAAIVAAVALIALIIWELTDEEPILDLSVFLSRNWLISTVTMGLMFGLFFGNIVLTPLWLQQMMGYTATWAGFATAPMGILAVVSAPIVGRLMTRIDPRLIVTYGMVMLAISFFMRAQLTAQADYMSVATAMFVLGAGVPACLITMTSLGVSDLPPNKVANGSGLQSFIRIMCMATGASLTSTYWESATKENRANLVSIIDPTMTFSPLPGLSPESGLAAFSRAVDAQAVMLATNDFYAMATILILIFAGVIWLAKRPKGPLQQVSH
ncbi:DHA2 family efflux MFS transporter permease subunit [Sphingomonas histidinilytica]|uniref:DHA2 family efflux MFS transporter permease subunit n=1 Tax=Rhizorhabdus histidinilytica TaxID=439228 RepID=UPI001ADA3057|nr:DHA2 family efflux MFS transporter permease subunit [Rhizorhabdus histidinilytica]MBO9379631.1 DHA2 family efflux MFS transporter permease subunit [Rhizorhabdus histidinilytica]